MVEYTVKVTDYYVFVEAGELPVVEFGCVQKLAASRGFDLMEMGVGCVFGGMVFTDERGAGMAAEERG